MKIRDTLVLLFVLALPACSGQRQDAPTRIVTDMLGREVALPDSVGRIVCVRAGALRLLVYMDASNRIAGREEGDKLIQRRPYLIAHPELQAKPVVGPLMGGDAEMILHTRPDIIFTAYTTTAEADDLQKKTGVPVVALECPELGIPASRDTLYASFRLIGKILRKEERADSLIGYMETMIQDLGRRTAEAHVARRPSVYVGGIAYGAMKDVTSTQPYYPPFLFTHADNVAASIDRRLVSHVKGTTVDKEQLLLWNPDVLFFDESALSLVYNDIKPGGVLHNHLKAVQNNAMYTMLPYNNYAINYELVFVNSWYVGKVLYPGAFADIDMEEKANEILTQFLGKPIFRALTTADSFRQINKNELE
jgi:iron complex transport system substrate-binding protein